MTVRNVKKSLIGMQDIAQGSTDQTQNRNTVSTVIREVDIPFSCATVLEMQSLDILQYTRARVYLSTTEYIEYLYNDTSLAGISSNTGPGSWIEITSAKPHLDLRSALYDFDVQGGAIGDIALATLFQASSIVRAWYEVITAPTSAGAATIAFGVDADDATGLKATTAYNDATFNTGYHDFTPNGAATNFTTKTTAIRALVMTIAGDALTAGKIRIWYELIRSE